MTGSGGKFMSIKINKLEIENVKRVKAVKVELANNGLTIVGGNNNQGKTSVLDAIAWATAISLTFFAKDSGSSKAIDSDILPHRQH